MVNQLRRFGLVSLFGILAVAGAVQTASAAPVLPDFTVDLNPVSASVAVPTLRVADKFTGNYSEILTITGAGTFATEAYWDAGQLVHDDGTIAYNATTGPNGSGLNGDYQLYGLFSGTGTFTPDGSGGFDLAFTSGNISLYLDQNLDTTKTLPAAAPGAIVLANTGDDGLMASAPQIAGAANAPGGLAAGDYGLVFQPFTLTALGSSYFVAPVPFYLTALLKGQFNNFDPSIPNQFINGSADAFFQAEVPEPATLTLLGIGLAGMARRRRSKKA